jgi:triacylglycerol lipase
MMIVAWLAKVLSVLDPAAAGVDASLPPMVLVHGIHGRAADMSRLAGLLRADGREVFTPSLRKADGSVPLEQLSEQLEQLIDERFGNRTIDLVGYSMGGIVSRHYVQCRSGGERVRRLVTLSSPHNGTILASLHPGPGSRQMRRNSEFLQSLNREADELKKHGFISFWTATDLIILPATSSRVPGAMNRHHWGLGHISFILERRLIRRVVAALRE